MHIMYRKLLFALFREDDQREGWEESGNDYTLPRTACLEPDAGQNCTVSLIMHEWLA